MRLDEAFPRELALRCQQVLWSQLEEDRDDRSSWHRPVVRLGSQTHPAFSEAAQSRRWVAAIHELTGPDAAPHATVASIHASWPNPVCRGGWGEEGRH